MYQNEMFRLLTRAAARCAYDLRHAATEIWMADTASGKKSTLAGKAVHEMYHERAEYWIKTFSPKGVKDYRDELHHQIWDLESKVEKLRKILEEHGIEDPIVDDIPF